MPVADSDLSKAERLLWESFPRGAPVSLRDGGAGQVIRAEVIRALLLGAAPAAPGFAPGLRLAGARITGRLDLAGATLAWPLTCEDCQFEDEIVLDESVTRSVRIVRSQVPAVSGVRLRADGIISLRECSVAATVRLDQARVAGEVCLRDASVGADPGALAVSADGLSVEGDIDCAGLRTRGGVSLQGLQVTGSLHLAGARVDRPGATALAIGEAAIGGRLVGRGLQVDGETLLHDSTVTRIELTGALLSNGDGLALSGGGLIVTGGMFGTGGFTVHGQVWLVGARISGNLSLGQATLSNPGRVALRLDRASIGTLAGAGLQCTGQLSALGVRIASDMNLERAEIDGGGAQALSADGAAIEGTLRLTGLRARGEVTIRTARIGQRVLLTSAQLDNPGGTALALSRADVASDLFCMGTAICGGTRLGGARIGGHLDLSGARLASPGGTALNAITMQAGELSLRPWEAIVGRVDLRHARVGVLRDDPARWPAELSLDGLTYSALEPQLPAGQRLDWLARHQAGHQLQPYEQLAAHYSGLGQPAEARRVLYARERLLRRGRAPLARGWSVLQDVTVAYGYQPWRALLWLALLLAAGSILYSASPPPPFPAAAAPPFNAVAYTLDLLLPVVDLGLRHAFNPAGVQQWFAYLLIAAGWILATTVAAGAARVLSRG